MSYDRTVIKSGDSEFFNEEGFQDQPDGSSVSGTSFLNWNKWHWRFLIALAVIVGIAALVLPFLLSLAMTAMAPVGIVACLAVAAAVFTVGTLYHMVKNKEQVRHGRLIYAFQLGFFIYVAALAVTFPLNPAIVGALGLTGFGATATIVVPPILLSIIAFGLTYLITAWVINKCYPEPHIRLSSSPYQMDKSSNSWRQENSVYSSPNPRGTQSADSHSLEQHEIGHGSQASGEERSFSQTKNRLFSPQDAPSTRIDSREHHLGPSSTPQGSEGETISPTNPMS